MTDKPKFDVEEITSLLNIPALIANNAPTFTHIGSEAMSRLREINEGLKIHAAKKIRPEDVAVSGQPVEHPTPSKPVDTPTSAIAKEAEEKEAKEDREYEESKKPDADEPTGPNPNRYPPRRI